MATLTVENLTEVNEFLANHNYVNGDLPGADDVRLFNGLKGLPPKDKFPEVYFWYLLLSSFTPAVREQWAGPKKEVAKAPAPAPAKKEEPKKADDDVDLFGDDDEDTAAEAKKLAEEQKKKQAEAAAGKKKKAVIAKTIVIFEVKVYEATDMAILQGVSKKIKAEINPEGLVWGQEVKYEEVAFGAKKIVMSMIIEDEKVLTDDVFDQILAWEDDVQSVDIASMQKV